MFYNVYILAVQLRQSQLSVLLVRHPVILQVVVISVLVEDQLC